MPLHAISPTTNTVGARIRQAREAKRMTQLALAHALGWVGPDAGSQISRFESGKKEPRLSTVERIAEALDVKTETLLTPVRRRK